MTHDGSPVIYFMYILLKLVPFVDSFKNASFVSDWNPMKSHSIASEVIINHNLGEYPAKVDVQVKVTDNGEDYIFTGFGSAHVDNDNMYEYGGVVYLYNDIHVKLLAPYGVGSMQLAYTGGSSFTGPATIGGTYGEGFVRVRVWKQSDFETPSFEQSGLVIDVHNNSFHEINHHLNNYPDLVSVQVEMDNGYISDAQGNAFVGLQHSASYLDVGGVVYGYDQNRIRLWAPTYHSDICARCGVFSSNDGWGSGNNFMKEAGILRIRLWVFSSPYKVFTQSISPFGIGLNGADSIDFPNEYDIDQHIISVEVTVNTTDNSEFRFQGAGSCLADGVMSNWRPFGGVVYVYSNKTVLLYVPEETSGGHLVYIGGQWGNGQYSEVQDSGSLTVTVLAPNVSPLGTTSDPYVSTANPTQIPYVSTTNPTQIPYVSTANPTQIPYVSTANPTPAPNLSTPNCTITMFAERETAVDMVKSGNGLFWVQTKNAMECTFRCTSNDQCRSFFYHTTSGVCGGYYEMYEEGDLQVEYGYKYFVAQFSCIDIK